MNQFLKILFLLLIHSNFVYSQCTVTGGGGNISAGTSQTYSLTNCDPCKNCNSPNYWYVSIPAGGSITVSGVTYTGPSTQSFNSNSNLTVLYNTSGTYSVWWEWGSSTCSPSCPGGGITFGPTITVDPCTKPNPCWNTTTLCELSSSINLNTLLCASSTTGGTWSGTGVTGNMFNPSGLGGTAPNITYTVGTTPCDTSETHPITITPQENACWNGITLCENSAPINLNTLLCTSATLGGTWSGTGVSGNLFNPNGYGGLSFAITYQAGSGLCAASEVHAINIIAKPNSPNGVDTSIASCNASFCINLNTNRNCSNGSLNWYTVNNPTASTSPVSNPTNYCTSSNITLYGFCFDNSKPLGCQFSDSIETDIIIVPTPNPCWNSPPSVCESNGSINLTNLLCPSATSGGTWGGTGVSGNIFNPSGLGNQNISISYTVGTPPCDTVESHIISVLSKGNPCFTPSSPICENSNIINLNSWLCPSANPGGTWSGNGVSGSSFNPSGFGGQTIAISYTTGVPPCDSTQTHNISITALPNPCWTPITSICEKEAPLDLNALLCTSSTNGGSWSGTGVSAGYLNPSGLGGQAVAITYQVGQSYCDTFETHYIAIEKSPSKPSGNDINETICENSCYNLNNMRSCNTGSLTWYLTPTPTLASIPLNNPSLICPTTTTTYYGFCVNTSNSNLCLFSDSVETTLNVLPETNPCWQSPPIICDNQGLINLNDWLCASSTPGGTWSGTNVSGNQFNPNGLGGLSATITYTTGTTPCDTSFTQDIIISNTDASFLTENFCIGKYNTINIIGDAGGSFSLVNITSANINNNTGIISGAELNETYSIKYKVTSPCLDSSIINIKAVDCDSNKAIVFVPNSFTPDNDGFNDFFKPIGINVSELKFYIFNRWGELIFKTTDIEEYWDGTHKGEQSQIGVYVWRMIYKELGSVKPIEKIGHVNLIR